MVYCLCALEVSREKKNDSRLVFVYDSPWVGRTLHKQLPQLGISTCLRQSLVDRLDVTLVFIRIAFRILRFLRTETWRWIQFNVAGGCGFSAAQKNGHRIVIRSWLTRDSFDDQGRYKDRNFGSLIGKLKLRDYDVWILPMYFNLGGSYRHLLSRMRRSNENFLLPEEFLTPLSLFGCLWRELKSLKLKILSGVLDGIDFSCLIRRIHLERSFAPDRMSYNRVSELLKSLSKKSYEVERFVYPFENNAVEKAFLCSVAKSYPDAVTIGFQHSVWYREQLGMFLAQSEAETHPLPNTVVCSGRRYVDVLTECGFPAEKIRVGPSLRFSDLHRSPSVQSREKDKKVILIILNFDLNQGKELLQKAASALRSIEDMNFDVLVKSHPLLSERVLESYLGDIGLTPFSWATGRVQDLVAKSDLVLMTFGSVSNFEVMVAGVPLLTVSLDGSFDFDPLWDRYPLDRNVKDSESFVRAIKHLVQLSREEKDLLGTFGRQILAEYFSPESDRDLEPFVGRTSM